jgi:hypothetical protein
MSYISSKDGSYYEGDKQSGDIDVPQRPSSELPTMGWPV